MKAHARKRTRGVRRHLRSTIVPNTTRFVPKVTIHRWGKNPYTDAALRRATASAYTVLAGGPPSPEIEGLPTDTIFLVQMPPRDVPISIEDVLAHEDLHQTLLHEEGRLAGTRLDRIANYDTWRKGKTHRGGIPD